MPAKTTIGSLLYTALIFILPLLIGAILLGWYVINRTNIDIALSQKDRLEKEEAALRSRTTQYMELENEKKLFVARLNEVSKCVDTFVQWTPVLISLAKNIPNQVIMDNLSSSNLNAGAVKSSNDPNKPLVIPIPQKKMAAMITGQTQDVFNLQIQDYEKKLNSEELLKPYLRELKYSLQGSSCTMNFTLQKQKK